jgi:hypothetical protein
MLETRSNSVQKQDRIASVSELYEDMFPLLSHITSDKRKILVHFINQENLKSHSILIPTKKKKDGVSHPNIQTTVYFLINESTGANKSYLFVHLDTLLYTTITCFIQTDRVARVYIFKQQFAPPASCISIRT